MTGAYAVPPGAPVAPIACHKKRLPRATNLSDNGWVAVVFLALASGTVFAVFKRAEWAISRDHDPVWAAAFLGALLLFVLLLLVGTLTFHTRINDSSAKSD